MTRYTRFPPYTDADVNQSGTPALDQRSRSQEAAQTERASPTLLRSATSSAGPMQAVVVREWPHPVVLLFMASLLIPIALNLGPLRITPSRLVLLVMAVPVLISWLSGNCGRIRLADVLVVLFSAWMFLAFRADGISTFQYAAISVVETVTPFLLARRYIRTEAQHAAFLRLLLWIAILLLPGAAVEALTGMRLYTMIFEPFFQTHPWVNYPPRWGMFRAQTVFEHPILYGVFVASFFAPVYAWARLGASRGRAIVRSTPVLGATFFSLSAGAYTGLNVQILLMLWGLALRRFAWRWRLLGALAVIGYVVVDVASNRTPFQVFSTYLAFNASTAYWRVLILQFGMENVWAHPFLGMGLNDWVRPGWMNTPSVDNFWLLNAMRYGIPGFILILGAYLAAIRGIIRSRPISETARRHRDALAIALIGLGIAIVSVHLWSGTYNFLMFMMGVGAWLADAPQQKLNGLTGQVPPDRRVDTPMLVKSVDASRTAGRALAESDR